MGFRSHFIEKLSINQTGFPVQCLEENCAVSQHISFRMTLTQERNTYPAAADAERHTRHLSLQLEQGQRHSEPICFTCYAAYKGLGENVHGGQNLVYDTFYFSHLVLACDEKIRSCHFTVHYDSSVMSSGSHRNLTLFYHIGLQPLPFPVCALNLFSMSSKTETIPFWTNLVLWD